MAKQLLLIALIFLITSPSIVTHAQSWRPLGFETYPDGDKEIFKYLSPITNSNKYLVKLLFTEAHFSSCNIKVYMLHNRLIISIDNKAARSAIGLDIPLNEALISENFFNANGLATYVIVSDQTYGSEVPLTFFLYFYLRPDGKILNLKVTTKKTLKSDTSKLPFLRGRLSTEDGPRFSCE